MALVEEYFRPQFEVLLGILDEMLPDDTSQAVVRQMGFSVLGQCLYYRFANEVIRLMTPEEELAGHFQTTQIAEHITRVSLAAIGAAPPLGRTMPAEDGDSASLVGSPQHLNSPPGVVIPWQFHNEL